MTISRLVSFTFVVIALAAAITTAQETIRPVPNTGQAQTAVTLPEYAIEVRRPDGCLVNTISNKSKRGFLLYTLPRPAKTDDSGRPISKVFVAATLNGEKWDVRVTIGTGEFYDAGDTKVGEFKLDLNQRAEVSDFSRFGLKPIRVGVVKIIRQGAREPKFGNLSRSISLESTEATNLPEPFKLELKNNSERDLIAVQYNTFSRGRFLALKWLSPGLLNPLIKAGQTYKLEVNSEDNGCGDDEGYRPSQSNRVDLVSAVFADGIYEGEPGLAALIKGTALGNRANLEKVVYALRYTTDPAELALLFNDLQERLNEEADPYLTEMLCSMFPMIARDSRSALVGFIRSGMHEVKVNVMRDAQYFRLLDERPNSQLTKQRIERLKSKYERWHTAAETITSQ